MCYINVRTCGFASRFEPQTHCFTVFPTITTEYLGGFWQPDKIVVTIEVQGVARIFAVNSGCQEHKRERQGAEGGQDECGAEV